MIPLAIDMSAGLTAAGAAINEQVGAALPIALPIGAGILAVTLGWRFFKRFVKG